MAPFPIPHSPLPAVQSAGIVAKGPVVFVVAGEASGDQHAAMLGEALAERSPVRLVGVGQERMRQAGFELILDSTGWSAITFTQALKLIPKLFVKAKQIRGWIVRNRPDLVVLVDFGAFNVRLARQIKPGSDLKVLYYFPPRSWSRSARGYERIAHLVDRVATPFPWSAELLGEAGIDATWVGHPVIDRIAPLDDAGPLRAQLGLRPDAPVIGILPGSRPTEIRCNGPQALGAAKIIREELPDAEILLSLAPGARAEVLERQARRAGLPDVRIARGTRDIVRAADLVITSSGTATLEAAAAGCPMVAFYRGTALMRLELRLRRRHFTHIAMPNIIADRRVMPEFVDDQATAPALAEAALSLLQEPDQLERMRDELLTVRDALGEPGVSGRVAEIGLEMLSGSGASTRGK